MKLAWLLSATLLFLLFRLQAASVEPFQPGDRWCVVGDSITHGGRYHDYIYLFYATRFPERRLDCFNCGIAGDSAPGTLRRLNDDILRHRPTVATIMLGMNDVGSYPYLDDPASPDLQKRREASFTRYSDNMRQLTDKLQNADVRVLLITPSPYDDTAALERATDRNRNAALGRFAEVVRQLAQTCDTGLVDFHQPMTELNHARQQVDPHFTLIGPDRVHPDRVGHFVMAYLFLKAQGVPRFVSDISVDAGGTNDLEFTRTENALPFPVPAAAAPALKLVPFVDDLNQERLRVTGLPAGTFRLLIDDKPIAAFDASVLANGVNLATLTNTPQYQQAVSVARLDEQRFELMGRLRMIAYVENTMGRNIGDPSPFDFQAEAQRLINETNKPAWWGYVRSQAKVYLTVKPKQAELEQQLENVCGEMRKASQPRPHQFRVQP